MHVPSAWKERAPLANRRPTSGNAHPYAGCIPALLTMHEKERAIGPAFRRHLGLPIISFTAFDTDSLGTFTGEIPRRTPMLELAIHRARLACSSTGRRLGIGSEGSFGPHPYLPLVPADTEVMVLHDRETGHNVVESLCIARTNFAHLDLTAGTEADAFLQRCGFPEHAVVVSLANCGGDGPIYKGIRSAADLTAAIATLKHDFPDQIVRLATDMRAHMNPTRMAVIRMLAGRLARRAANLCPYCKTPGYGVVSHERGLPCARCASPTKRVRAVIEGCSQCRHSLKKVLPGVEAADPSDCAFCNP